RFCEIEQAPFGVAAVDRHLLEGLDQVGGTVEVGDELLGGFLAAGDELIELGATYLTVADLLRKTIATAREARGARAADADRVIHLVCDAGDQAAERGELLGLDQALLGLLQLAQGALGALL